MKDTTAYSELKPEDKQMDKDRNTNSRGKKKKK